MLNYTNQSPEDLMKTIQTNPLSLIGLGAICLLSATGCATTPANTGVTQVAPDVYRVVARGQLGLPMQNKAAALSEADRFCADKGRSMQVVETGKALLAGPFEVTFQCPVDDDPEAPVSPMTKSAPSAVPSLR